MRSIRAAAFMLAAFAMLVAGRAAAQESARIMALGGWAVSGVIPDPYTDLYLSPIYALDAETLALWYTRRNAPSLALVSGLPYAESTIISSFYQPSFNPSNETALHGLRIGAWRLALMSSWSFKKTYTDDSKSLIQTRWANEIQTVISCRDTDADAWMLDLAAARPAGGERTIGLRVRGRGLYNNFADVYGRHYHSYDDSPFINLTRYSRSENGNDYVSRRIGFDLQGALGRKRNGLPFDEISLTVSLHRLARISQTTSYESLQRLNSYGMTTSYNRSLSTGSDSREGDLWSVGAAYRRSFTGGIRLYTEGSLAILSYDAASGTNSSRYAWDSSSLTDNLFSAYLSGDGSVVRGDLSARAGKTFTLHRTLDLHVTAGGVFVRSACEEDPFIRYVYRESGGTTFGLEVPVSYSSAETRASLAMPLSIDFRPSSWFSYFAAFITYAQWSRVTGEKPFISPFILNAPAATRIAGGQEAASLASGPFDDPFAVIETRSETFETNHSFSCGFSLRYNERFAVDLYTRSDIVPIFWHALVGNVRCGF